MLDKEVVAGIVSGDRSSINNVFRYLYNAHYLAIVKFVVANKGTESDAADNFQQSLLVLFDQIKTGRFKGKSSIKTYLYAINRNLWLKELLKKNHENSSLEQLPDMVADSGNFEEAINFSTKKLTLSYLLEQLGDGCKQVLTDFYYRGLSIKEIADNFSLSNEDSAKNKKYRCMKKLMDLVRDKNIDMNDISLGH